MEPRKKFVNINNFSGGLADSDILGLKGSYVDGAGLNIHSNPGLLTVNQLLKKDSGATVTDFARFGFFSTDGNTYWFGDTGLIYKRTSGGSWSNVRNEGAAILGAAEWNGYFYWATATSLHEMIKSGNFTTDVDSTAGWPKTLTSATWHPMSVQGIYLCIGNAQQIATVDNTGGPGVFTAGGTPSVTLNSISPTLEISSVVNFGLDLIVGTRTISGDNAAEVRRWDTFSPNYTSISQIQESVINSFLKFENNLYAQCGGSGYIYFFDGETLQKFKRIPGNYDNQTMTTNPGSSANFRGLPLIGVSNSSSNPCNEGVFSLGRYDKNYPIVLNLEYVISGQATGHLSNVQIGGIVAFSNTLLVGWKDTTSGTVYGVDVIDWNNKYTAAYIKTTAIQGDRYVLKIWTDFMIAYKSLPASTSLALSYFANYGSKTPITIATQTKETNTYYGQQHINAGVMQYQIDFTVSGNSAPIVEGYRFDFTEDNF